MMENNKFSRGSARGDGDQRGGVPEPGDADEAHQGVRVHDAPEGDHGGDGHRQGGITRAFGTQGGFPKFSRCLSVFAFLKCLPPAQES